MVYKAKVDWWIGAALVVAIAVPAAGALFGQHHWVPGGVTVFSLAMIFGGCYPQSYGTAAEGLIVRAGLTKRVIPYSKITGVRPSSDGRSALALTLDRVAVEYGSGSGLLIGPANQEQFFEDMARRCPQLSPRGQGLAVSFL